MMSIYQSRSKRPIQDDDLRQSATRSSTAMPACPPPAGQDWAEVWSDRRKATPARNLLPVSVKWFVSLPIDVRPLALVAKYPRIANVLALQWDKPAACRASFNDLLGDRRGNRKGFPADVHRDLRALRDFYYDLHPPSMRLTPVD